LRFCGRFITTVVTPLYFSTLTTSWDASAIPVLLVGSVTIGSPDTSTEALGA
jgi:hypothetical protein